MPPFADRTFTSVFEPAAREPGDSRVLLWTDTFNNHFHPNTLHAAVRVLEAAGFAVETPQRDLCCGRPLYDWGMLGTAKRLLRKILDELHEPIAQGIPIVVLEPSCLSVFRDELPNLFPNDQDAARLSQQTFLLGEFLQQYAPHFSPIQIDCDAIMHGHCHQKAIANMKDDEGLLERMGVRSTQPESGCCGMAGSFGFERGEHYDVSMRIGERALLPAVRSAASDTLVVADGFSCREQIEQGTGRRPMHLAEVLSMALEDGAGGEGDLRLPLPHQRSTNNRAATARRVAVAGIGAAVIVSGSAVLAARTRRG